MKRVVLSIPLLLAIAPAAFAQNPSISDSASGVSFVPSVRQSEPKRSGFTALVKGGVGVRRDDLYEETLTGVTTQLGIGAFVTDRVAVLVRYSATTAGARSLSNFSCSPEPCRIGLDAGVVGATAQFWLNSRFAIEAGAGLGFWFDSGSGADTGFGLILGGTASIVSRGHHHLTAGFEYAPAFTPSVTIHTFGFVIGYQFIR
jgi:hypothetical protein